MVEQNTDEYLEAISKELEVMSKGKLSMVFRGRVLGAFDEAIKRMGELEKDNRLMEEMLKDISNNILRWRQVR